MEQKNIYIICATLIVIAVIICGTIYFTSVKDTKLSISDTKVTKGDKMTISLVDENGNPLVNKNITINVTNFKNKSKTFNATTNDKGQIKFKVKIPKGKYIFNIEYPGDLLLKSSNIIKNVTVKEKEAPKKATTSYSSSSHPLREGVDYDFSELSPSEWESIENNPYGHYDGAGNYYPPGQGQ